MMTGRFVDRVAVITGSASGIGLATAIRMSDEGAAVLVADIDGDGASRAADLIRERGGSAVSTVLDVRDADGWSAACELAVEHLGAIDVLVNNAGAPRGGSLKDMAMDQWRAGIDANLTGAFLGMQAAAPALASSDHASVVNVSSIFASSGAGVSASYAAAKAGVLGLTRTTAVHWAPDGIRVNSLSPGLVDTPFHGARREAAETRWSDDIPLGRFARPDELAASIAFLASDDAAYITGIDLVVDGGFLAR